jgi:uncharacterized protein
MAQRSILINTAPSNGRHHSSSLDLDGIVYVGEGDLGKGLFARKPIKKGSLIYIFQGPIINFLQAKQKGEKECYPLQIDHDRYIDIEPPGCFSNHSCEPNAGIRNQIELTALRNIEEDEEIRYDYSTTMDEDHFTMPCRCGTPTCRGVVADFKLLSLLLQKTYLSLGIVMEFISRKHRF